MAPSPYRNDLPTSGAPPREGGQVLPLIAVFMLVLIAFAGLVIDVGNVYRAQNALQASTDAAAAAGAGQLTLQYPANTANAIAQAKSFDSATGGKNPITGIPPAAVSVTVNTSCVGSNSNLPCNNANTVTVSQTANVPTYFMRVLGFSNMTITTSAQACSPCNEVPLDIQLVVDRTGSMSANGGSTNGQNKWENLQDGLLQGFLPGLDSGVDNVGMSVLPPDINGTSDVCRAAASSTTTAPIRPTPSFRSQTTTWTARGTWSELATDQATSTACSPAAAPTMPTRWRPAYNELQAHGRPGVQKIIVLLSDGAANKGRTVNRPRDRNGNVVKDSDPHCMQPCQSAVNDATTYKQQGS